MARALLLVCLVSAAAVARAEAPALDDARLGPAAGEVHAAIDRAARAGLPQQILVDKVQEGLAKHVPPPRIAAVVRGLGEALARARAEAQPFAGAAPPPGLLKALVEAHAVGVKPADAARVLRAGGRERAIEVLTDLVQRGYPAAAAAHAVGAVGGRARALDRLVGEAERLRAIDGAAPTDALEALVRANAQGLGLDHAEQLLHRAPLDDAARGPNRETSGARGPRSGGVAAPGHGKGRP